MQTATDADGSTSQSSAMTASVAGLPPVNTPAPSLSAPGVAQDGETVTGARGTWTDATSTYGSATPPPGTFTMVAADGFFPCAIRTDGALL